MYENQGGYYAIMVGLIRVDDEMGKKVQDGLDLLLVMPDKV